MKSVLRRSGLTCLALIVVYFTVPIESGDTGSEALFVLRIGISAAALAGVIYALGRQVRRQFTKPDAPLGGLVVGVVAGLLLFALADYAIAVHGPGQFVGLSTRLDALYFALTTLLTVGFGDISAHGQFARGVLCLQMLFNVIVLATVASFIAREIPTRARSRPR